MAMVYLRLHFALIAVVVSGACTQESRPIDRRQPESATHSDAPEQTTDTPSSLVEEHERVKEPLFRQVPTDTLASIRNTAQETLPAFKDALLAQKYPDACYQVKAWFADPKDPGHGAHIWVLVSGMDRNLLNCLVYEAPKEIDYLKPDDRIAVALEDVNDWMIIDDGKLYGGLSLRTHRKSLPPEEQAEYDEYVGVTEYSDELP